ncbi:hypothetical protein CR513_58317, partial [Mucuna pruriens]
MEHIWKHVMLFYVVLLFHHHLLPVHSEHQGKSCHKDKAKTMTRESSTEIAVSVNRRGGGGGHGGGHASSMGMHGGENGEHGNLPHPLEGGTIPLYGAAAGSNRKKNKGHHGKSNGTSNYVCFYHYLVLFLSIVVGVSLCN